MELKEFISETIKQIVDGVCIAQQDVSKSGAAVNPAAVVSSQMYANIEGKKIPATLLEFKIVLMDTSAHENSKGIGVYLLGMDGGVKGKNITNHSTETQVSFNIPIVLPCKGGEANNAYVIR
jgi:hypothetical protein